MELSPIVLFTYNRLQHTQQTVEALQNNFGASSSDLFIISDGPKTLADEAKVSDVRDYIRSVGGFKNVFIIDRISNQGLANNIYNGVTDVVNDKGKLIVLEDDVVTSPYFLKYMNDALDYYKDKKKVMHISGWNYPINPQGLPEMFLWRVMNCWGWATWADRWQYYVKDPVALINHFSTSDIHRFNLDGAYDWWNQIVDNKEGKINTWAVFWYATIFKNNGLCLNPTISLTKNIGLDGTGIHCRPNAYPGQNLSEKKVTYLPDDIKENSDAVEAVKKYLNSCKKPLWQRAINRTLRCFR